MVRQGKSTVKRIVPVETLAQHAAVPPPLITSAGLGWSGFTVERYRIHDTDAVGATYPHHVVTVAHSGRAKQDVSAPGGRRTYVHATGEALVYPAHHPFMGYDVQRLDVLVLYLQPSFVERAARDIVSGGIELVPQYKLQDAFLRDIGGYLLAEAQQGGASGRLYAESLVTALAVHLVRNYAAAQPAIRGYKGGITPRRLRRATEYINDNLAEDVSLNDIADAADMNVHHFTRTFKQATGLAPRHYLIRQRIEQAKQLLSDTELPISQVALAVGFADQSHFARMFRRLVGVTPNRFRKER